MRSSATQSRQLRVRREAGNSEGIQGASLEEATPVLSRQTCLGGGGKHHTVGAIFFNVFLGSLQNSRADSLRPPCSHPVPGDFWPFTPGYNREI